MEEEQSAWPSLSTAMAHQTLDEGNAFSPHRETTGGGVGLHPHSKASAFRREKQVNPLVRKISWRRKPHPSILAWRIPWTEEAGGLQSMGSQSQTRLKRLGTHACTHTHLCDESGWGKGREEGRQVRVMEIRGKSERPWVQCP